MTARPEATPKSRAEAVEEAARELMASKTFGEESRAYEALEAALAMPREPDGWRPIESAPKDVSVMLGRSGSVIYCGRLRHGNLGEPQQGELAWRCDSSGRFANPTHWMPLPASPQGTAGGQT